MVAAYPYDSKLVKGSSDKHPLGRNARCWTLTAKPRDEACHDLLWH